MASLITSPRKTAPNYFLRNRIKAEDITIDMVAYHKRKLQFEHRMKQMVSYVKEELVCRSRIIGSYFGDEAIKPCGICDNCLKQKATHLSKEEFKLLYHRIINLIKDESLYTKDLLLKLNSTKKERSGR